MEFSSSLNFLHTWDCLDSNTGEASAFIGLRRDKLAEAVRNSHLPDFSNWPPAAAFARAFTWLEKNLCTGTGR